MGVGEERAFGGVEEEREASKRFPREGSMGDPSR